MSKPQSNFLDPDHVDGGGVATWIIHTKEKENDLLVKADPQDSTITLSLWNGTRLVPSGAGATGLALSYDKVERTLPALYAAQCYLAAHGSQNVDED